MRSLTWCICRIKDININANVDIGAADALLDLLNDPCCADLVNGARRDELEAAAGVVAQIVLGAHHGGPDTGVDGGVLDEALLQSRT